MAKGPFGSGGGSTIAQPVGSQTKPTVTQRALTALRRVQFTIEDVKDPEQLYQILYHQQQAIDAALRTLNSNPTVGGNLLTGNVMHVGVTSYLNHGLGRPWRGVWCCLPLGQPSSFEVVSQPPNVGPELVLPLLPGKSGTYDFYVY